jgi:hypothetical protein
VAVGAVTGCGNSQDQTVESVANDFYGAVATRDAAAACAVLAPETRSELEQSEGKPCPQAVLSQNLPEVGAIDGVRVFGTMAQVRYGDETAFLTRFQFGWRVLAAACTPESHQRYDCKLKGA